MEKRDRKFLFNNLKAVLFGSAILLLQLNSISLATNITGINGNNGVFYIKPQKISGNTGFRQYANFSLDKGHTASLMFTNGITRYINTVDNQVTINGFLNTVDASKNFYNGKAIFISPKGFVVGASGIVNVGSLDVYTPSVSVYNDFKKKALNKMSDIELANDKYFGNGNIKINGMVLAREAITLKGNNIYINEGAKVASGFKNSNNESLVSQKGVAKYSQQKTKTNAPIKAEELFNALINSGKYGFNFDNGIDVTNINGNIALTTKRGTIIENATLVANGNVSVLNKDRYNVKIAGEQYINGDYYISQSARSLGGNLTVGGNIKTNGTFEAQQNSNGNTIISGNVQSKGDILINQNPYGQYTQNANKGNVTLGGTLESINGNVKVTHKGIGDIVIDKELKIKTKPLKSIILEHKNKGDITINENGKLDADYSIKFVNDGEGDINIKGNLISNNGYIDLIKGKDSKGKIEVSGTIKNNGIWIVNEDGTKRIITGTINITNDSLLKDSNINIKETGKIEAHNDVVITQNNSESDVNINGVILSDCDIVTNSVGDVNINGNIKARSIKIGNTNSGDINIKETAKLSLQNYNTQWGAPSGIVLHSKLGDINIDGELDGNIGANILILSRLGGINVEKNGYIHNRNAKIELTNNGDKDIKVIGDKTSNIRGTVMAENGYVYIKPLGVGEFKMLSGRVNATSVSYSYEPHIIIEEN